MLFLAYDGSIHGDWISHYAIQLAASETPSQLNIICVQDADLNQRAIDGKLQRMRVDSTRHGVELVTSVIAPQGSTLETILSAVPSGPQQYLICGTRTGSRPSGLLRGTVSEWLLRSAYCNVLAVRVVQPGLLGLPRRLLLPVAGHPRGLRSGLPFLRLFGPQLSHLQLLFVARVGHWQLRWMSHEATERHCLAGQAFCRQMEREIAEQLGLGAKIVDARVTVSDSIPQEILITAQKTHSRLIYMGASERGWPERLLFGEPIEQVLREATCDVAIYRGIE